MRALLRVTLVALATMPIAWGATQEAQSHASWPLRECTASERLGYVPSLQEVGDHRNGPRPVIRYETGARPETFPELVFRLRVDRSGRVVCSLQSDSFDRPIELTPERRKALTTLSSMRYTPFNHEGVPVDAIVQEPVAEEDIPLHRRRMPQVSMEQVRIRLERTGCFGTCPAYRVEIDGSGVVTYTGLGFVDVRGKHQYRISANETASLIEMARDADFWSLRESYRAGVTDNPTTLVTIVMGSEVHAVEDYVGVLAGMPRAMKSLQKAIDTAARTNEWINVSGTAVDTLIAENFRFDTPEGAALLARATANDGTRDDAALVRLVELGAPTEGAPKPDEGWDSERRSLLEEALSLQRELLVETLLSRGLLGSPSRPDRAKLDAAFQAAIEGGDLSLVQEIWDFSATTKPSLTFRSTTEEDEGVGSKAVRAPVSLLLKKRPWVDRPWQGLAIAQWLAEKGCDLRARAATGDTLLHVAAEAGDASFVRWLLARGLDPNALGEYDLPPLGSVQDEDVALLLLEAGSRTSPDFIGYARQRNWARVVALIGARGASD